MFSGTYAHDEDCEVWGSEDGDYEDYRLFGGDVM
jgi:hypothetical protein